MNKKSDRLGTFAGAWRQFQLVDARLHAIFDKYRSGPAGIGEGLRGEAMTPGDREEVAWLRVQIALLAPVLAALPMPKGVPLVPPTEKQVIQACRLAGWPQWRIDRKLTGERLARLDRRIGLLQARHGFDRRALVTRDQIATLRDGDREELLRLRDEWDEAQALMDRLSLRAEPPVKPAPAGAPDLADWFQRVCKAEAFCDFHAACQELETFLPRDPMTPDQLTSEFVSAAKHRLASMALEVVPVDRALRDIGFTLQDGDGPDLRWQGVEWGRTMVFGAGPGPSGRWCLSGWYKVDGQWRHEDAEVAAEGQRGAAVKALLAMWRRAFGPAVRPPGALDIGRLYEQHGEKFGRLDVGLPCIELDGPAFRAMRRCLRQRYGAGADALATLAVTDGKLRVCVAGEGFTVPAGGGLGTDCRVAVGALAAIPPSCLRGRVIRLERGWSSLAIDWYSMPIRPSEPALAGAAGAKAGQGRGVYYSLLTGTFAFGSGGAADTAPGAAGRQSVSAAGTEESTGPDLRECFFTKDQSDSTFVLLGYLRCPLSASALARLAKTGCTPDDEGLIGATAMAGKFWWVRGSLARVYPKAGRGVADDVQTTEALFDAIGRGYPAIVMDGPFDNEDDGHYALDVAWESPDG